MKGENVCYVIMLARIMILDNNSLIIILDNTYIVILHSKGCILSKTRFILFEVQRIVVFCLNFPLVGKDLFAALWVEFAGFYNCAWCQEQKETHFRTLIIHFIIALLPIVIIFYFTNCFP